MIVTLHLSYSHEAYRIADSINAARTRRVVLRASRPRPFLRSVAASPRSESAVEKPWSDKCLVNRWASRPLPPGTNERKSGTARYTNTTSSVRRGGSGRLSVHRVAAEQRPSPGGRPRVRLGFGSERE
mgnify:CR=1 FL=1